MADFIYAALDAFRQSPPLTSAALQSFLRLPSATLLRKLRALSTCINRSFLRHSWTSIACHISAPRLLLLYSTSSSLSQCLLRLPSQDLASRFGTRVLAFSLLSSSSFDLSHEQHSGTSNMTCSPSEAILNCEALLRHRAALLLRSYFGPSLHPSSHLFLFALCHYLTSPS
ncbi:hypothetical protein BD309DRAFT_44209 [Dichomitus squalens]|uniref:Uncharacterized protein n=1 Tax=Dichomitus squalens TaxID=114155 RepID=A0A4Q9QBU9_9APHY|nr:hypothetical protein BD309DRAFT_44209 [Dichomitus squalens]TBU65193.1 hypothetical protein BD310DRAFT_305392 [Dichomitus squalens]